MQPLEVISVNVWQILISLANLVILFLAAKRFLFGRVESMLLKRQGELDKKYTDAENNKKMAQETQKKWEEKMLALKTESENILKDALNDAKRKSEKLIQEATEKAENIVNQAKQKATDEMESAKDEIKAEIIDVSLVLAEKILMREISKKDNSVLINSFIEGLKDDFEGDS